jgi:two-component system CheB/CheR fusion protein
MLEKTPNKEFEALLEQLKQSRGFDFTGYKRTTLMRRVQKRMQDVGINAFTEYADYLEVHQDEFRSLFNTILINVTSFYRDPEAWEALLETVIKPLAADENRQIRVWSAGCASGEETYTLVMVLAEVLGMERFKKDVKVYATDADADALMLARQARYSTKASNRCPNICARNTSRPTVPAGHSAAICDVASSSASTTWCRTHRSRASTCSSAAIP